MSTSISSLRITPSGVSFRRAASLLLLLLLFASNCQCNSTTNSTSITQLTSEELKNYIDQHYFDVIIDVRAESEWGTGHIPNATWLLLDTIVGYNATKNISSLDTILGCESCTIVAYCRSGARAAVALQSLQAYGFSNLYNGLGVSQWSEAGYSLVNTPSVIPSCSESNGTCQARNNSNNSTSDGDDSYTDNNSTTTTDRCNPDLDAAADAAVAQSRMVRCGTKNSTSSSNTTNSAPVAAPSTAVNIGTSGGSLSSKNRIWSKQWVTTTTTTIALGCAVFFCYT